MHDIFQEQCPCFVTLKRKIMSRIIKIGFKFGLTKNIVKKWFKSLMQNFRLLSGFAFYNKMMFTENFPNERRLSNGLTNLIFLYMQNSDNKFFWIIHRSRCIHIYIWKYDLSFESEDWSKTLYTDNQIKYACFWYMYVYKP